MSTFRHAANVSSWREAAYGTVWASCRCPAMFLFFSNKLGCIGSLLLSAAISLVLLLMLGVIRLPGG